MDIQLEATCARVEGWLNVEYTLANHGSLPLLTYDGAPGVPLDAEWPDLTNQIYVSADDARVALKRVNPPMPSDANINRVFIPPLSITEPGRQRRVRMRIAAPLVERSQYTPDFPGAIYRDQAASRVELWVGYFWKTSAMMLVPFPANPRAFRLGTAHGPQQFVSASMTQDVVVRVRTDAAFIRI